LVQGNVFVVLEGCKGFGQSFEKGREDRTCTSPMGAEFPGELEHLLKTQNGGSCKNCIYM